MQTLNKDRFYKYNNYDGAEQVFEKLSNILLEVSSINSGKCITAAQIDEDYSLRCIEFSLKRVLYAPTYDAKTELTVRLDFSTLEKRLKRYPGMMDIIKNIKKIIEEIKINY